MLCCFLGFSLLKWPRTCCWFCGPGPWAPKAWVQVTRFSLHYPQHVMVILGACYGYVLLNQSMHPVHLTLKYFLTLIPSLVEQGLSALLTGWALCLNFKTVGVAFNQSKHLIVMYIHYTQALTFSNSMVDWNNHQFWHCSIVAWQECFWKVSRPLAKLIAYWYLYNTDSNAARLPNISISYPSLC